MSYGNTVWSGGYEYRADILARIKEMLDTAINKHNKVFVVRLDIRYPDLYQIPPDENPVTEFFRRLMAFLKYHGIYATYLSVREQNTSHHPHYHCFILLDGNKVENGWTVWKKADEIWKALIGEGSDHCIHRCETLEGLTGIMLRRPPAEIANNPLHPQTAHFEATKQTTLNWLAYLAKTYTKGNAPAYTKEFHSSRL